MKLKVNNKIYKNVDNTEITHVSLCAGYGGIDLGLKRCIPNLRTVAFSEIEAFACELLLSRMEGGQLDLAPIWSDLKSFPWASFRGMVDILSGGYPCQPFSSAGKRLGTEDPRHLWPYIADGICILRPRICFFENVEGHISLGLSTVISDLEEMGYKVSFGIFSASECGASHQRKRVFILGISGGERCEQIAALRDQLEAGGIGQVSREGDEKLAHRNNQRLERYWRHVAEHDSQGRQGADGHAWPSRPGHPQHAWEPPRVVGNATATGQSQHCTGFNNAQNVAGSTDATANQWQTKPPLGGDADGTASGLDYAKLSVSCDNRTDELRLLGNGVVPATAAKAFRTLIQQI